MSTKLFIFYFYFCILTHAIVHTSAALSNSKSQQTVEYFELNSVKYLLFSQHVTWPEADMLCQNNDAKLAILDTKEKAEAVMEAISESNSDIDDAWIGGRRIQSNWIWFKMDDNSTEISNRISMRPDKNNFPPWIREPTNANKACLAINRILHAIPVFVDLECRLLRPFICEKNAIGDSNQNGIPSKYVVIGKSTFSLYHRKSTWLEAATFCRDQGARLAIIKNKFVARVIANSMTTTRPDFEQVWIGARFYEGHWTWLATGTILSSLTDETGYPPWRFGKAEKNSGCLLLDRHLEKRPNFIGSICKRKRDFICEEYPEDESEDWMNEPIKHSDGNYTFVIYPIDKTWNDSRVYCQKRASSLATVKTLSIANTIIAAMGDHPQGLQHVWLGGLRQNNLWRWIENDEIITINNSLSHIPPWASIVEENNVRTDGSSCLNLDRNDHVEPYLYGLNCNSKQPFVCDIGCDKLPPIDQGNWECNNESNEKHCSIKCNESYVSMGLEKIYCTPEKGWNSYKDWLELPICLDAKAYVDRMIKAIYKDLQKSDGYYIILGHFNKKIQKLSFDFAEQFVKIFPLSNQTKMGMTSYITLPASNIIYEEIDSCEVLDIIPKMKSIQPLEDVPNDKIIHFTDLEKYVLNNFDRRTLIIAFVDPVRVHQNKEIFEELRDAGHYVIGIGLKEDWEALLPITTIGFDQHLNLYLFSEEQFEVIYNIFRDEANVNLNCSAKSKSTFHGKTSSQVNNAELDKTNFNTEEDKKLKQTDEVLKSDEQSQEGPPDNLNEKTATDKIDESTTAKSDQVLR
ncbi:uncharacterized protein LOC106658365 [Trichogramma pretiosum]|uniref:uncharacterized protein LOC106658365 n=1 Tax=Trichogramma pretiosum TaxID=7493 RepID=UPI0006C9AB58|nr:uncharacterized protein LOC106658365 [Trichogramma pretiosum]